jgi:copper oxidase (laccase) domain-containing protein
MRDRFGCEPGDLRVMIGPAIRPPWFEVDIPAMILADAVAAGVRAERVADCGICTHASAESLYYSYRREKGCTGRMVALAGRLKFEI